MKTNKILLIGLLLFLISCILFVVAIFIDGFEFSIFKEELIEKPYTIDTEFNSISADLKEADFYIYLSKDNENKVICYEKEKVTFDVEVIDGVLKIKENKDYKIKLFNFSNQKVLIYLNQNSLNNLEITSNTGNILIQDINFNNIKIASSTSDIYCKINVLEKLEISVSTGSIKLESCSINNLSLTSSTGSQNIKDCEVNGETILKISRDDINISNSKFKKSINISGSTSDIEIENVNCFDITIKLSAGDCEFTNLISEGNLTVNTSTGDVEFTRIDANNIYITTDTGDVEGTILTDKLFAAKSNTGKTRVPDPQPSGECKITTDTGDIIISIAK